MRPFVQDFFDDEARQGRVPAVFLDMASAVETWKPAALIVATPNHLHMAGALEGASHGLHLLIEKPAHDHVEGLDELMRVVDQRNLVCMIGYNLRFHPSLARIKSMIGEGALGTLLSAAVEVGENIEDWHPWEEYRETYAPHVASGGGALLCFSHDIDYLYWLLGAPNRIHSAGGKVTNLSGDAEDLVQSLWSYDSGLTATLHIDYFQRPKVRTLKIVGTERTVLWDAYGSLSVFDHETGDLRVESLPEGFDRNDMFMDELRHFVSCLEQGTEPMIPLKEGKDVVELVEAMKQSLI